MTTNRIGTFRNDRLIRETKSEQISTTRFHSPKKSIECDESTSDSLNGNRNPTPKHRWWSDRSNRKKINKNQYRMLLPFGRLCFIRFSIRIIVALFVFFFFFSRVPSKMCNFVWSAHKNCCFAFQISFNFYHKMLLAYFFACIFHRWLFVYAYFASPFCLVRSSHTEQTAERWENVNEMTFDGCFQCCRSDGVSVEFPWFEGHLRQVSRGDEAMGG